MALAGRHMPQKTLSPTRRSNGVPSSRPETSNYKSHGPAHTTVLSGTIDVGVIFLRNCRPKQRATSQSRRLRYRGLTMNTHLLLPNSQNWIDVRRGTVSREAFTSDRIFELEMERIFDRNWVFIAHESEIPQPGDFVVRTL